MVAALDYCRHGLGGAAPSIDTFMHAFVDAAHVDHLHPDSGIAFATSKDGERLTKKAFGDKVVWVPWRRPGFQLGLDISAIKAANPDAIGCILGGHGITAWGATSAAAQKNSLWIIATAEKYLATHGKKQPFGRPVAKNAALPAAERRAKAAALAATIRGIASHDKPMVGHFTDAPEVLDFLASTNAPKLAALGTSCPDHFLRTKVKPMLVDLPADAPVEKIKDRLAVLHAAYRKDYTAYYEKHATKTSPAMRGADPLIVLVPGVGMFSYGAEQADRPRRRRVLPQRDQCHARRRVDLDLHADLGCREVRDRVLGARRGEAAADAEGEDPRHPHRPRDRRGIRHRQSDRRRGSPPTVRAS